VAANRDDGTRVALSDWNGLSFVTRTPAETTVGEIERADIPRVLDETFGLPGFVLGDHGRVTRPAAHSE
jgi:hypothetical protein